MKELYCDRCNEETVHNKYKNVYYCVDEIEYPKEMQRLKELEKKSIAETGFPF